MDLSLGLLGIAAESSAGMPAVGECLRESVRRYDSIGLTSAGGFVLVLPGISRRGLDGAAERLRRQLSRCVGHRGEASFVYALAHYDGAEVSASEMLLALESSLEQARAA